MIFLQRMEHGREKGKAQAFVRWNRRLLIKMGAVIATLRSRIPMNEKNYFHLKGARLIKGEKKGP